MLVSDHVSVIIGCQNHPKLVAHLRLSEARALNILVLISQPRNQVLTFQFSTELMFIAIDPFEQEFFFMLVLKSALNVFIKGGLLKKLHIHVHTWSSDIPKLSGRVCYVLR